MKPTWRKPAGIFLILALIVGWAVLVASQVALIGRLPILAQALVYLIAGVVWIAPMGPLLRWMETGKWRG